MDPPPQVPTLAGGDRGGARGAKKIAIAGAVAVVVVSAPVVLPALLILFAVGVALALPAAFFLASIACADKLMSSFLGRSEELGAGNCDSDGETVADEGDGVEIPVDTMSPDGSHSSSASEVERHPPREVGQESRDIEVAEPT